MIIKHVTLHQNWRHKRDKKRGTSETKRESQARYRPANPKVKDSSCISSKRFSLYLRLFLLLLSGFNMSENCRDVSKIGNPDREPWYPAGENIYDISANLVEYLSNLTGVIISTGQASCRDLFLWRLAKPHENALPRLGLWMVASQAAQRSPAEQSREGHTCGSKSSFTVWVTLNIFEHQ